MTKFAHCFKRLRWQSARRYSLVLICSLLLAACSSTRMGYEMLDWYAMWKIGGLVDLNSQQHEQAEQKVHMLHRWHRQTQLPIYADYVQAARQRVVPGSVTAEQLHAEVDRVQLLLDDSLEKVLPPAAEVIATLSDDQVDELLESLEEEREEYIEESVEPGEDELAEKNAEKLQKHLGRFVGRFTREQKQWVSEWSQSLEPYAEMSAKQQLLWQEHLAKYLALREDEELLVKGLRELMLYRTDNWHPELQQAMDANQAKTYKLVARILNNLNERQTQHLEKTLDSFVKDFTQLSRKG